MTAVQIFAAGIAIMCDPRPRASWPYAVQDELDTRDRAIVAERAAEYGTREWLAAKTTRICAESRIGRLLDVPPREREPLNIEPWFTWPTN